MEKVRAKVEASPGTASSPVVSTRPRGGLAFPHPLVHRSPAPPRAVAYALEEGGERRLILLAHVPLEVVHKERQVADGMRACLESSVGGSGPDQGAVLGPRAEVPQKVEHRIGLPLPGRAEDMDREPGRSEYRPEHRKVERERHLVVPHVQQPERRPAALGEFFAGRRVGHPVALESAWNAAVYSGIRAGCAEAAPGVDEDPLALDLAPP